MQNNNNTAAFNRVDAILQKHKNKYESIRKFDELRIHAQSNIEQYGFDLKEPGDYVTIYGNDTKYLFHHDNNSKIHCELFDLNESEKTSAIKFIRTLISVYGSIKGSYPELCIDLFGSTSYSDDDLENLTRNKLNK